MGKFKPIMGGVARRQAAAIALTVCALSSVVAFSEEAEACSWIPPETYRTDSSTSDTTAPNLAAADISVQRKPGNDNGVSCGDIGSATISIEASDDQTAQGQLGFSVTLVEGSLPFEVPERDMEPNMDGDLNILFADQGQAFQGTLEVRVVDRAGNRSEPVLVSASGDDVHEDEGCTCSAAGAPSRNYGAFLGLMGLMLLVNRRKRGDVLCSR